MKKSRPGRDSQEKGSILLGRCEKKGDVLENGQRAPVSGGVSVQMGLILKEEKPTRRPNLRSGVTPVEKKKKNPMRKKKMKRTKKEMQNLAFFIP